MSGHAANSAAASAAGSVRSASAAPDRGGWQMGWGEHGVPYYYHVARGLTQWEAPPAEPADGAAEVAQ